MLQPPQEWPKLGQFLDLWDGAVSRLTCWGEGCRVVFADSVQGVAGAAQERAAETWKSMMVSEGQFIFNLFRRQLAVFIPSFDPALQIQADLLKERSFWLRDLNFNPAAFSVLIPLAPPGLNFTSFWASDVRVSWRNLLSLDTNPIMLEIDSVRATAAESPAGTEEQIESLVLAWLDVLGGSNPVPFQRRYPLLDGATFRVRRVHLDVRSPTRYGNLSVDLEGVEIVAVDEEGRQRELSVLCKAGLREQEGTITFHRLVDCRKAAVRYAPSEQELPLSVQGHAEQPANGQGGERFLLDPTAVAAMLTQKSCVVDLRRVILQRWTIAFPGPVRILALPPLLAEAEAAAELPPQDRRLFPHPAPPTQWHVRFADGMPFHWHSSPFQPHRPQMHPIAAVVFTVIAVGVVVAIFADLSPKPWLQRVLAKASHLRHLLY